MFVRTRKQALRRAYSRSYNTSLLWHDYASWAVTSNGANCTTQNFCFCFNALDCKVITFVLKGETENESCRTTPPLTIFLFWHYNCCVQCQYVQMFSCNQNIRKSYNFKARSQSCKTRLSTSPCMSIHPQEIRLPMDAIWEKLYN
jgi:hypothetical protein